MSAYYEPAALLFDSLTPWDQDRTAGLWGVSVPETPLRDRGRIFAHSARTLWAALNLVESLSPMQIQVLSTVIARGTAPVRSLLRADVDAQAVQAAVLELSCTVALSACNAFARSPRRGTPAYLNPSTELAVPAELLPALRTALKLRSLPADDALQFPLTFWIEVADTRRLAEVLAIRADARFQHPQFLLRLLAAHLQLPTSLKRLLSTLQVSPRRLFEEIRKIGKPIEIAALLSQGSPELQSALEELVRLALVSPVYLNGARACIVHPSVQLSASGAEPNLEPPQIELKSEPEPEFILSCGLRNWWNLIVTGQWVEQTKPRLTAAGTITKKDEKTLSAMLAKVPTSPIGEIGTENAAFSLLGTSGLLNERDGVISMEPTWRAWCTSGLERQFAHLAAWWIRSGAIFSHLPRLPGIEDDSEAAAVTRGNMLRWLARLPTGGWVSLSSFMSSIQAAEPFFLRRRAVIKEAFGQAGLVQHHLWWRAQEGVYIRDALTSLPFSMGLIDLGGPREILPGAEESTVIRLTPVGRRVMDSVPHEDVDDPISVLQTEELPLPCRKGSVVVQPNLEVVLLELHTELAYRLGWFAEPISYDRVGVFRITPLSVRSAASSGTSADEMLEVLRTNSAHPLPQNVDFQLREWAGSVKRVDFTRGTVVETESPEAMELLLAARAMKGKLLHRMSPTLALLSAGENVETLARNLETDGFMWSRPDDWESREAGAVSEINRTLRRHLPPRRK